MREQPKEKDRVEEKSTGRVWPEWYPLLAKYRKTNGIIATWQLLNTVIPYFFPLVSDGQIDSNGISIFFYSAACFDCRCISGSYFYFISRLCSRFLFSI